MNIHTVDWRSCLVFSRSPQPGPDKNMPWNFGHLLLIPPPSSPPHCQIWARSPQISWNKMLFGEAYPTTVCLRLHTQLTLEGLHQNLWHHFFPSLCFCLFFLSMSVSLSFSLGLSFLARSKRWWIIHHPWGRKTALPPSCFLQPSDMLCPNL